MANTGGGVVILGVEEKEDGTIEAVGLEEIIDKEKQHSKISKFCQTQLNLIFLILIFLEKHILK